MKVRGAVRSSLGQCADNIFHMACMGGCIGLPIGKFRANTHPTLCARTACCAVRNANARGGGTPRTTCDEDYDADFGLPLHPAIARAFVARRCFVRGV